MYVDDSNMLSVYDHVQIYLWNTGIDMRKGFHGLEALVSQNGLDPFDGSLFVFFSKNRTRVKILTWTQGGFAIYYKHLQKGRFPKLDFTQQHATLRSDQLRLLLDRVDFTQVKQSIIWEKKIKR